MENPFIALDNRIGSIEMMLAELLRNQPQREEKLHTVKSLAEFADVSELTVRNWITRGTVKAKKIDGTIRIPESQFLNGLEDVKSLKYQR